MIKLSDLFHIEKPNTLIFSEQELVVDWINFVSSAWTNNWIVDKVRRIEWKKIYQAWSITVPLKWSVLQSFLQTEDFYCAHQIAVLTPKVNLSDEEKIYYCLIIRSNKYRYNYWRQGDKTIESLLIPSREEIPEFVYNAKIPHYWDIKKSFNNEKLNLYDKKFDYFEIQTLFEVKGTKTTKKDILGESWIWIFPYITTQSTNNGVAWFYSIFTEKGWVLTIDSAVTGFCTYQEKDFSASDHVEKLIPKFEINRYIWKYLTTIINKEAYRYNYWRKFNQERIKNTKIKLPVDDSWNPDRQFMEDYIKSLPYSKYL
jgi:Type I restriction modification DNA specificity domain